MAISVCSSPLSLSSRFAPSSSCFASWVCVMDNCDWVERSCAVRSVFVDSRAERRDWRLVILHYWSNLIYASERRPTHNSVFSLSVLSASISARNSSCCVMCKADVDTMRDVRWTYVPPFDSCDSIIRPFQIGEDHICFSKSRDEVLISARAGIQKTRLVGFVRQSKLTKVRLVERYLTCQVLFTTTPHAQKEVT